LIQKWLKAGVLEEGQLIETTEGTPQGSVISPLLANVYLHYVYDLWADQWRSRHAKGEMIIVRYADDVWRRLRSACTPRRHGSSSSADTLPNGERDAVRASRKRSISSG